MSYLDFRRKNPTFQDAVGTLTSNVLSPDTKAIALWSMGGDSVTGREIWKKYLDLAGIEPDDSPAKEAGLFSYFYGTPERGYDSSLVSSGLVRRTTVSRDWGEVNGYALTDAGYDFAVPVVARATQFVNMLAEISPERNSMWRIMGSPCSRGNVKRGYVVYMVVKSVIESPDGIPLPEIYKKTGLLRENINSVTKHLDESRVIELVPINGRKKMAIPAAYTGLF